MAGLCERGDEPSSSLNVKKFLDNLSNYELLKERKKESAYYFCFVVVKA
jgi:hypothetical protein